MERTKIIDFLFENVSKVLSVLTLIILGSMLIVLFYKAVPAMEKFGIDFLFTTDWAPNFEKYGGWPSIYGTLVGTFIAMIIATPMAIGIAIFLSEIAPKRVKSVVGSSIELLAAIPSIIYGMWGLFYFAPIIRDIFGGNGIGILTAGLILSIMILPFVASITRDSMDSTPDVLKESAYALGATKWDVVKDVVIPFAKAGILGSVILALGRALGETMAVTFVIGNSHHIPSMITDPATNIPATLANEFAEADDIMESVLFYLAFILFVISTTVIAFAKFYLLKRRRRA